VPRPLRFHVSNGIWHVTHLATDSEVFFREPADFRAFLEILGVTVAWAKWRLHDYCLMTNHLHLLVQTPLPTLASGMRRLMATYVEEYNAKYERRGALVHGRYGAKLVDTDDYYEQCLSYVANNPVTAGLCLRPEEWPWSGYARRLDASIADVWGPGPDTSLRDGWG
jgi:REP element-mobilizing transposase RayT